MLERIRNEICHKATKARETWMKNLTEDEQNNLIQGKVDAAYSIVKKNTSRNADQDEIS